MIKPNLGTLPIALTVMALSCGWFANKQAAADSLSQTTSQQTTLINLVLANNFDPPGEGKPDNSSGGAARGYSHLCQTSAANESVCVVPIVPASPDEQTVSERPTFVVYVPQTDAETIFFGLIDESNESHYQTQIPLPEQPGMMRFQLPPEAPELVMGKTYRWTFVIIPQEGLRPDTPGVEGQLQRVANRESESSNPWEVSHVLLKLPIEVDE